MKVAILQHDTVWEDPAANHRKIEALAASVADRKPDLICMAEMFSTGFTMNVPAMAQEAEGPTFQFLSELARRTGAWVQGTFPERIAGDGHGFNTCATFDPDGGLRCRYHKVHPFAYGGEDRAYRKGRELPVFALGEFQAATPICYDLRFPELFRKAMRQGANLFIVPANWPVQRAGHWRSLAIARAIENLSWVVGINRVGQGGNLTYGGGSLVVSPLGEAIAELDAREQANLVDIDLKAVTDARERFHFLDDARADLFPDLFA